MPRHADLIHETALHAGDVQGELTCAVSCFTCQPLASQTSCNAGAPDA